MMLHSLLSLYSFFLDRFQSVVITYGTLSPIDLYPCLLNFHPAASWSFNMSVTRDCICPTVLTCGRYKIKLKCASIYYSTKNVICTRDTCFVIWFWFVIYLIHSGLLFSDQLPVSTKIDMRSDTGAASKLWKALSTKIEFFNRVYWKM